MPKARVYMLGRALPEQFALGPLRFTGADQFPLDEIYCDVEENEIVLVLSGHFAANSPWRGDSMVVFFLYRLPSAKAAFRDRVKNYRKNERQKTVKLPEKQPFDQSVFEFDGVSKAWKRSCFAVGPRNVFQLYESSGAGIMVRWYSQQGTMLDHPLLGLVRDSVQLVAGQWETEIPPTRQSGSAESADDSEGDVELVTSIDLRKEQKRIRGYIQQRVTDYAKRENHGPGKATDPIRLITLGFYAEQAGYAALVFDTRRKAEVDGAWTTFLEEEVTMFNVAEWCGLYTAIGEGQTVTITDHKGRKRTIRDNEIDEEELNSLFGEMLSSLMLELRKDGTFTRLPLHRDAFFVVEEFDGRYFWPTFESRKTEGAVGERD